VILPARIDADQRQIPVRLIGMAGAHLLERLGHHTLPLLRHMALDQGIERLVIGMDSGRQPQCRPEKSLDIPGAAMIERGSAKRLHDRRHLGKVGRRVREGKARHRVAAERQGNDPDY